jgi:hypothetical protein
MLWISGNDAFQKGTGLLDVANLSFTRDFQRINVRQVAFRIHDRLARHTVTDLCNALIQKLATGCRKPAQIRNIAARRSGNVAHLVVGPVHFWQGHTSTIAVGSMGNLDL